ncbi:MAG: anthranilate synthase component I family protein [Planctomycetota bacterium]
MNPRPRAGEGPFAALLAEPRGAPLALLQPCGAGMAELLTEPVDTLRVEGDAAALDGAFERLGAFLARHTQYRCAGWLGYDLRDAVESLPRRIDDDLAMPSLFVGAFARMRRWPAALVPEVPAELQPSATASAVRAHISRLAYEARVARVVEHIRAGDLFQANLTQPFTGELDGDPRALFWRLCACSPAPFASYVETGDGIAVLSSSPEEFLTRRGPIVRTRPIKGTRPRSDDAATDRALRQELLASDKDRAELAMIVDLMRNDLGKVAQPGTVRVGPFPEEASFAQVHHLFATVTATLREDCDTAELLRATFPPGSITGAPKLRCMEILEELEVVRRGVYTGAVGVFGPGSRLSLNVAIRTMAVVDGVVRLNAGGGVTSDSVPASEYDETLHKAAGMLRALRLDTVLPPGPSQRRGPQPRGAP